MPTTTNRDYPYPAGTQAPNGPLAFEELADAVDADVEAIDGRLAIAENAMQGHIAGTWQSLGLNAGFLNQDLGSSSFTVARHGSLVVMSGRVVRTEDGSARGDTALTTIPVGFRPAFPAHDTIVAYNGTGGTSFPFLRIFVGTNGAVTFLLLDGADWDSRHWIPINMTWRAA